jgi:hypothetical protein
MLGGPQWRIKRARTGPKRTICAVPVRSGARKTLKSPQGTSLGQFMNNFWMGLLAAQTAAADTKSADRRQRALSVLGGMALALLIGGGLFIAAVFTL